MPAAAPLPTSAPSPEYRRHHQVLDPRIDDHVFRPGWRVQHRLDKLLLSRALTLAEWRAAVAFRNRVERTFGSLLRCPDPARAVGGKTTSSPRGRSAATDHHLDDLAAVRQIEQHLGPRAYTLLTWAVVDDLSCRELGRRLGCDHKTARVRTIAAIKALASTPR
jgi:hypothetical protein